MARNILFVSHASELNGAEKVLLRILERLDRKKFKPFLITPEYGLLEDKARKLGINTEIVPMKWWISESSKRWRQPFSWIFNMKSIFRISRIISKKNISLVFSNTSIMFSAALASKLSRVPHIWMIHENLSGYACCFYFLLGNDILVRIIEFLSARIIVNSLASKKAFKNKEKTCLVYNGIEVNREQISSEHDIRNELNIGTNDPLIGVIGKISDEKGQKEIVLALRRLSQVYPQLKLLIIGSVSDDHYYEEILNIIKSSDLGNKVIFTGYRPDVMDILKSMDLVVIASDTESFGLVALEAMCVHTPVLAVDSGALPEIITHGKTGFLVRKKDSGSLREGIDSVLKRPDRAERVVKRAFDLVRSRFQFENQIKKIEQIMEDSLG